MRGTSAKRFIGRPQSVVPDGCKIFLYKKGSRGEVVGVYGSIKDIVNSEKKYNPDFGPGCVWQVLAGLCKYFASYKHQCKVKAVIRKVE